MRRIKDIATGEFDAVVLSASRPVLVDFWAAWCGPCRALGPVLADIADDFDNEIEVVKVDVEAEGALSERFGVSGLPTLILFDGGEEVRRITGLQSRSQLSAIIEERL